MTRYVAWFVESGREYQHAERIPDCGGSVAEDERFWECGQGNPQSLQLYVVCNVACQSWSLFAISLNTLRITVLTTTKVELSFDYTPCKHHKCGLCSRGPCKPIEYQCRSGALTTVLDSFHGLFGNHLLLKPSWLGFMAIGCRQSDRRRSFAVCFQTSAMQ